MSKRKWYTKAIYLGVALALCLGLTMVPAVAGEDGEEAMGYVEPSLAVNVKGACEEFCSYNVTSHKPLAPVKWDILPGVKNPQAVVVEGELGPSPNATACITIRALTPGDVHVQATYSNNTTAKGEKKWGVIEVTELKALNVTGDIEIDGGVVVVAGTESEPVSEEIRDTVIAWYYWGEEVEPHEYTTTAAHAVVHWWIFDKAKLTEEGLLDDLQDLGGCGKYLIVGGKVEWEDAAPYDLLEDIYRLGGVYYTGAGTNADTAADDTYFVDGVAGTDGPPADDCNVEYVDGAAYPTIKSKKAGTSGATDLYTADGIGTTDTYIKTMTRDDEYDPVLNPLHGTTDVTVENTGEEEVVIVTLVEYPWEFNGENPVCVEIGYKEYTEVVIITEVKTPQVRWAGEKIVLEKNWSDVIVGDGDYVAIYHMDEESIGTLYFAGNNAAWELDGGDIWVLVNRGDPISEVILESQFQGKADVEVALFAGTHQEGVTGQALVNTGFMVYYLAFEEVALAEDISHIDDLTPVTDDAEVAVQVKGWFTCDRLPGTDRGAVDLDGDGVYELAAGRYVLPDDWAALAGYNYELRPNWDLMDMAHLDAIVSPEDLNDDHAEELGPYDTDVVTTDPPDVADDPCIGPFNTLQPWSVDDMWIADDVVPADFMVAAAYTLPRTAADVRNTVVPDGLLNWYDCPMPQALVLFDIVAESEAASLSGLDKGDLEGYGFAGTPKIYQSPFYCVEIPSSEWITALGYNHDSWVVDGPYGYWTDLLIDSIISNTTEDPEDVDVKDVEVYCDNHGIAGVTINALSATGHVTIEATAEFPNSLKKGQYPPMTTEIDVPWGVVVEHLNPDFEAEPRTGEAPREVCFDPTWTSGGLEPYVKAEWDFGDDTDPVVIDDEDGILTMEVVCHNYIYAGRYTISLTITDSTTPDPLVHTETKYEYVVLIGEEPPAGVPPCDIDESGTVDIEDFVLFAASYGLSLGDVGYDGRCDLNESNGVDILDFIIFAQCYVAEA